MYSLKRADEHDFAEINNFIKKMDNYGYSQFAYYEALESYDYELEKVFSPRIVRHILFSKDKDWFIISLNQQTLGIILISAPNYLLESTSSVLLFAGFEKQFDKQKCDYSNFFDYLPSESTKISIRANEQGKILVENYFNANFELLISLENKEYYYAIFNKKIEKSGDLYE